VSSKEPLSPQETKEQLLWVSQEMLRTNLVQGTAGNCAARLPDGNAVLTPSSLDYLTMTLDDLVVCDLDGNVLEGERGPTTEKALHLSALREHPEIGATMHCHAKFATMFALTRQPIPAVIEEFDAYVGGDVEVAEYRTTGTDDLAAEVASRAGKKAAVLMANHGLFAVGKNPKEVLHIAALVERTAEIVWGAQAIGTVIPLPDEVNKQFSGYYRYGRTGSFDE
jgi:L-fuculose-phosphate aldolase